MYSINPLTRFTLITPDECTAKVPSSSLDSNVWISIIETAETRFVIPLLGWNLYWDLCNQKNVLVDSGNIATLQAFITAQFTPGTVPTLAVGMTVNAIELITVSSAYSLLWKQALYNYVFNCVYLLALTDNYARFNTSGIQKANPLDSSLGGTSAAKVGISLPDLKFLNDNILLGRINPAGDYLEKWICANVASYPLYPYQKCHDADSSRTTGFVNIYEEEDNCHKHRHSGWNNFPTPAPMPQPAKETCSITITIVPVPNGTLYPLCNLQTIPAQYAPGSTLVMANMIGKNVNSVALYNGSPISIGPVNLVSPATIGYNIADGTFDRTLQGGFNGDGTNNDVFTYDYTEML
jgi:hypothetical protein